MLRYNQKPPPSEALASIKESEESTEPEQSFNKHKDGDRDATGGARWRWRCRSCSWGRRRF